MDKQIKYFKWNPDRIDLNIHLGQEIQPLIESKIVSQVSDEDDYTYILQSNNSIKVSTEQGLITRISISNQPKMSFFKILKQEISVPSSQELKTLEFVVNELGKQFESMPDPPTENGRLVLPTGEILMQVFRDWQPIVTFIIKKN
ncbi:hypothetical protein K6119_11210 [Paracrocinitomix mangrovi]|uniref:hypothetical protein n=1 Tax=Paracrocinitomix mangrovi TaxID=2862509 RepID=UPI001C8DF0C9|nr:hypothetical protein [Paracrocinitomix mangrovi]UKN00302.1 hypothetical protein K6119_11210 [Paracrocinitomix mangrovi]